MLTAGAPVAGREAEHEHRETLAARSEITMRRVLLVAFFFPPLSNSGTQRPLKFANYLPEFGWEPIVLTVDRPPRTTPPDSQLEPELLQEVREGMVIERVPFLTTQVFGSVESVPLVGRIADALDWRVRNATAFPDHYFWWRFAIRQRARALAQKHRVDAVFATGFPWSSLLAGRDLARASGVPLITDFRDPWTRDDLYYRPDSLRGRLEVRLERRVLASSAAVTTVTDEVAQQLRDLAPPPAPPIVTIPNGYDPSDLTHALPYPPPPPGVLRIVYTGVIWKTGYNPFSIYDALARLRDREPDLARRFELVAAGFPPGEAARRGVADMVTEIGSVSHATALGIMRSADLLALPVGQHVHQRVQVPGKLYEYLAVGRPVLALTTADGATGRLLRQAGGGIVLSTFDPDEIAQVLARIAREGPASLVPPLNRAFVQQFDRRALTKRLAAVLDSAVEQRVHVR
jgi:glycosyltransferase involved in cell wall biosynthesis